MILINNTITLKELEKIILERKGNIDVGINEELLTENHMNVDFKFKEFKNHNRLDCTVWVSILPFDFKLWLTKDNCFYKVQLNENKKQRVLGKKLLIK